VSTAAVSGLPDADSPMHIGQLATKGGIRARSPLMLPEVVQKHERERATLGGIAQLGSLVAQHQGRNGSAVHSRLRRGPASFVNLAK
jgi:hypothetical protein